MKTNNLFAFAAAALLLAACSKPAEPVSTFDLEKVKAAITEANQKLMTAWAAKDSTSFVSMYHSQATVMPANGEISSGAAEITKGVGGAMKALGGLKLQSASVWGDADLVVEEGTYELTDNSGAHADHGKYIVLWKEEGGSWKLYRDIWNSNMPMAMPAPPAGKK